MAKARGRGRPPLVMDSISCLLLRHPCLAKVFLRRLWRIYRLISREKRAPKKKRKHLPAAQKISSNKGLNSDIEIGRAQKINSVDLKQRPTKFRTFLENLQKLFIPPPEKTFNRALDLNIVGNRILSSLSESWL